MILPLSKEYSIYVLVTSSAEDFLHFSCNEILQIAGWQISTSGSRNSNAGLSVGPPLCSRLKYFNNYYNGLQSQNDTFWRQELSSTECAECVLPEARAGPHSLLQ